MLTVHIHLQEVSLETPHIDRVLHQCRAEGGHVAERRGREEKEGTSESTGHAATGEGGGARDGGGYELRLVQLERQLSQLLQRTKVRRDRNRFLIETCCICRQLGRRHPLQENHTLLVGHMMSCDLLMVSLCIINSKISFYKL